MEIIGDDKRIRALFSEVRFADERAAPSFAPLWHRAESRALKPRRALNLSLVAATALLVFALASLAVWSKFSQSSRPASEAFAVAAAGSLLNSSPRTNGVKIAAAPELKRPSIRTLVRRPAAEKHSLMIARNRKVAEEAKQIASWTSPTASLLSSSSDDLFKSLPQLNENATDLKSFLPTRSNDKEN